MPLLVNYWAIHDGSGHKIPEIQDVGSQKEMKRMFMSLKERMIGDGWEFSGSWQKKRYIATKGEQERVFFVYMVNDYFPGV